MLVVTDQGARRVGRKRGLTGAGQTEEDCRLAIWSDIGGAMHGEDVLVRQGVVEEAEDRLLDLTRVACAADKNEPLGEVHQDEGVAPEAIKLRDGEMIGGLDNGDRGVEIRVFLGSRADEHVAREQAMPSLLGDDPGGNAIARVSAGKHVRHIGATILVIGDEAVMDLVEDLFRNRGVGAAPIDGLFGQRIADNELILGRAARVLSGDRDECAAGGEASFTIANCMLVKLWHREVFIHSGQIEEPVSERDISCRCLIVLPRLRHVVSPRPVILKCTFPMPDRYAGSKRPVNGPPIEKAGVSGNAFYGTPGWAARRTASISSGAVRRDGKR